MLEIVEVVVRYDLAAFTSDERLGGFAIAIREKFLDWLMQSIKNGLNHLTLDTDMAQIPIGAFQQLSPDKQFQLIVEVRVLQSTEWDELGEVNVTSSKGKKRAITVPHTQKLQLNVNKVIHNSLAKFDFENITAATVIVQLPQSGYMRLEEALAIIG